MFYKEITMEEAVLFNEFLRTLRRLDIGKKFRSRTYVDYDVLNVFKSESIKGTASHYSMEIEPYDGPDPDAADLLLSRFHMMQDTQ